MAVRIKDRVAEPVIEVGLIAVKGLGGLSKVTVEVTDFWNDLIPPFSVYENGEVYAFGELLGRLHWKVDSKVWYFVKRNDPKPTGH